MKITVSNYADQTKGLDFDQFPSTIQKGHDFMQRAGRMYDKSDKIKKSIDLYISQLNALQTQKHVDTHVHVVKPTPSAAPKTVPSSTAKKSDVKVETQPDLNLLKQYGFDTQHPLMILDRNSSQFKSAYVEFLKEIKKYGNKREGYWEKMTTKPKAKTSPGSTAKKGDAGSTKAKPKAEVKPVAKKKPAPKKRTVKKKVTAAQKTVKKTVVKPIEKPVQQRKVFSKELQIIKRFANMHGKRKTLKSIELLHNLCTGLISKGQLKDHKSLVLHIKKSTGELIAKMKKGKIDKADVTIKKETLDKFTKAIASAKERLRVSYLAGVEPKTKRAGGSGVKKCQGVAVKNKYGKDFGTTTGKAAKILRKKGYDSLGNIIDPASSKKAVLSGKELPKSMDGFVRADQAGKVKSPETFRLKGSMGEFLGDQQAYKLAITLSGPRGAGKTWFGTDLINSFIDSGYTVGMFSIEQGGLESKDTKAAIDHNVKPGNLAKLAVTGEAKNGIDTVKKYADQFDVIVIDSWQKLGLPNTDFDRLRQEHPKTIWIVIFQLNANGGMRNGVAAEFDAPVVLKAKSVDATGKQNFIVAEKNRGNKIDQKYMIHDKKVKSLEEE